MVSDAAPPDAKRRRRERLHLVVHWLTVVVVFTKGLTKLEHGAGFATALFSAALLIALGTIFHHRLEHRFPYFNVFFFLVEAAVLFLVGWLYQHDGTRSLHLVIYGSAALYLMASVIFTAHHRSSSGRAGVL